MHYHNFCKPPNLWHLRPTVPASRKPFDSRLEPPQLEEVIGLTSNEESFHYDINKTHQHYLDLEKTRNEIKYLQ